MAEEIITQQTETVDTPSPSTVTSINVFEPIYRHKDGRVVTKSQLIKDGITEDRINAGITNGIITQIGDTEDPDQQFKHKDGRIVSVKELNADGITADRISNGLMNGIIIPIEKKNQVPPQVTPSTTQAPTPKQDVSPSGASAGVSDSTTSTEIPQVSLNKDENVPSAKPIAEKTKVPEIPMDQKDPITLVMEANNLLNAKKSITNIGTTTMGTIETLVPDDESIAKGKQIQDYLASQKINADDLYNKIKDIPSEIYDWHFTRQDGTVDYPYSKEKVFKMYTEEPLRFEEFANNSTNRVELQKAVSQLPEGERKIKGISPISVMNEYNDLNRYKDWNSYVNNNVERQKEIINTYIPNLEDRKKALDRLEKNVSLHYNYNNPSVQQEYNNSDLKDKLDISQYSALQVMKMFHPDEYKQAINFLNVSVAPEYEYKEPGLVLTKDGFSLRTSSERVETEDSIDKRLGKETLLKKLSDQGRYYTTIALQYENEQIAKKLKSFPADQSADYINKFNQNNDEIKKIQDENAGLKNDMDQLLRSDYKNQLINKYNDNISKLNGLVTENQKIASDISKMPLDEKNSLIQKYNENLSKIDAIKADYKEDDKRYPLTADLKYDMQVKDYMQQAGFNAAQYGAARFGMGLINTGKSLENTLVSLFGDKIDNILNQMERSGESKREEADFYLPETYQTTNGLFTLKFDDNLRKQVDGVIRGRNISDLSSYDKDEIKNILLKNQDQIQTITNPAAGKSKNFFSLATLYANTGMIGDITSFAVQAGVLTALGVPEVMAAAIPMYTTSQNDFYKEAIAKGMSDPDGYANAHAFVMFVAGLISPTYKIAKRAIGLNTEAGKMMAGISEKTWNDVVNKNSALVTRISNSVSHVGKEAANMALTYGAGTSLASDIINKELYNENITPAEMVQHAAESTKHLLLSSAGMLGLGFITNFKAVPTEQKAALWQLSDNPQLNIARINEALQKGELNKFQAEERIQVIKDAEEAVKNTPKVNAQGKMMTDRERLDYFCNQLIQNKAKEEKKSQPKAQQEKIEYATLVADHTNNLIIDPKTPEELQARKEELENFLQEEDLQELPKLNAQAELEAINDYTIKKENEQKPSPTTDELLSGKEAQIETTPTEIGGLKVVGEETPVGGERVFKVVDEDGNERFLTADGKELRVAKATAEIPTKLTEPTEEQKLKDIKEGNFVTFTYGSEEEVPTQFKDKISSRGETNGKKFVRVTLPKSVADYELAKAPEVKVEPTTDIEAKKADIERRRQEELKNIRTTRGLVAQQTLIPEVNAKYDAELTALEKASETKIEVPKEGDKVTLPPQVKGGMERTMVFNEGEWKQEVGGKPVGVGESIKQQAQAEFDKPKVEAEPTIEETKPETIEPVAIEQEGQKTFTAQDIKDNPESLKEDQDYYTLGYPDSFVSLYTDRGTLQTNGYKDSKQGDIVKIGKKDYVIESIEKSKNKETIKLLRVDENGNILREKDLSKKEKEEKITTEEEPETQPETTIEEPKNIDERKSLADKIRQFKTGGDKAFDATIGLPVAIWDGAVELVATSIETGMAIADAIKRGVNYIEKNHRGKWNKKEYNDKIVEALGYRGMNINGEDVITKPLVDKQSADVINGFYSPLEQGILDAKLEKATGKEWAKKLEGTTEGDELKFTGMSDFLSQNADKSLTKQEVLDYMKNNRIQINEIVLGGGEKSGEKLYQVLDENGYDAIGEYLNEEQAKAEVEDNEGWTYEPIDIEQEEVETKYHSWQLPGEKTDYKEILITFPITKLPKGYKVIPKSEYIHGSTKGRSNFLVVDNEGYSVMGGNTKEEAISDFLNLRKEGGVFKSDHFDEPNILAHIRMNTRVDAEGNKVIHIEEFQSDWGKAGRTEGFAEIDKKVNINNTIVKLSDSGKYYRLYQGERFLSDISKEEGDSMTKENLHKDLVEEANRKLPIAEKAKTPIAPFVTETANWTKLAWKVALKEAVKEGADKITWTTGEQQNERYDLSKQVKAIMYGKRENGTYDIRIIEKGSTEPKLYKSEVQEKELESIVGKEVAKKIIDNKGEDVPFKNYKRLSGVDLQVGGTGMKGFYGSPSEGKLGIVGEVAKSLFKQEPKTTEIGQYEVIGDYNRNPTFRTFEEAKKELDTNPKANKINSKNVFTQHSIDITPEIKQGVKEGMAMFKSPFTKLAENIRKGKIGDDIAMGTLPFVKEIWNGAVEAMAAAVEISGDIAKGIKEGIEHIRNSDWYKNLSILDKQRAEKKFEDEFSHLLPKTPPKDYLDPTSEKRRVSGFMRHLMDATNVSEDTKKQFKENGIKYKVANNEEARRIASDIINVFGEQDALTMANTNDLHPSVRSAIFAESIDRAFMEEQNATNDIDRLEAARKWKDISIQYDKELTERGQFTAYAGHFYKTSPLGFVMKVAEQNEEIFNEWYAGKEKSYEELWNDLNATAEGQALVESEFNKIYEKTLEQKGREAADAEIQKLYEQLKPEKKKFVDKALDALDRLQQKIRKNTYSDFTGMTALVDAGITTIKAAIKAGVEISKAIEMGVDYIKKEYEKATGKKWDKEDLFRKDMTEGFGAEGIETEKTKVDALQKRIEDLQKQIKDYKDKIAQGGIEGEKKEKKFSDDPIVQKLIEERDKLKKENEELLKEAKVGKYSDASKIEAAKKEAIENIKELERQLRQNDIDIKNKTAPTDAELKAYREKQKELRKKIEEERKAQKIGKYSDAEKLKEAIKKRQEKIDEYNRRINDQEFSAQKKKTEKIITHLDDQLKEAKKKYEKLKKQSPEYKLQKAKELLDKYKSKLQGVSEEQAKEIISRASKKIIEAGGLEHEEFKKIIADVIGVKELTKEDIKKIESLVDTVNAVEKAEQAMVDNPTQQNIAAYNQARRAGKLAMMQLGFLLRKKSDLSQSVSSIIRAALMSIFTTIRNVGQNIVYTPLRFSIASLNQFGDSATYLASLGANKISGGAVKVYEPTRNIFLAQKGYLKKGKAGLADAWFNFYKGTQDKDIFGQSSYTSTIAPFRAWKELNMWRKNQLLLTKKEVIDRLLRGTLGVQSDFIYRGMAFGDKPPRWGAEGAESIQIARYELKITDPSEIDAFMLSPQKMAYKILTERGMDADKALKISTEIQERIQRKGSEAVLEQENLLSKISKTIDEKLSKSKEDNLITRAGKSFLTLSKAFTFPFVKIPANAYWIAFKLNNPLVPFLQSILQAKTAYDYNKKGEIGKSKEYIDKSKANLYFAGIGLGLSYAASGLVAQGYVRSSNDEDNKVRETTGERFYGKQNQFNWGKFMGGKDYWIDLNWFGPIGTQLNVQAQLADDRKKAELKGEKLYDNELDALMTNFQYSAVESLNNLVFNQGYEAIRALKQGKDASMRFFADKVNQVQNIFVGGTYVAISKATLPEEPRLKADTFAEMITNNLEQKNILVRLYSKYPPSKVSIWGDPIRQDNSFAGVIQNCLGFQQGSYDKFGAIIYNDFFRTQDARFFPAPEDIKLRIDGKDVKLKQEEKDYLDKCVGKARKGLVDPFIMDSAVIPKDETNEYLFGDLRYSEIESDEDKILALNVLYDEGKKVGMNLFVEKYQQYAAAEITPEKLEKQKETEAINRLLKKSAEAKGLELEEKLKEELRQKQ